jgi:hypothetical protein
MYRSVFFALLLMLPGAPVAAQHTTDGPLSRAALRTEEVVLPWTATPGSHFVSTDALLQLVPSLTPLPVWKEQALVACPDRDRRIFRGAALGLVIGGAVGFLYTTERRPNPGIGDVPAEVVYVPLFAIPAAILGGVIGARTARCA